MDQEIEGLHEFVWCLEEGLSALEVVENEEAAGQGLEALRAVVVL